MSVDTRLDAIDDAIDDLATDWGALIVAAKGSTDAGNAQDILNAGKLNIEYKMANLAGLVDNLDIKQIAIDLHTGAS